MHIILNLDGHKLPIQTNAKDLKLAHFFKNFKFSNNSTYPILKIYQKLQPWMKYLEQNREIQANCTGQENFDVYFCVFLDYYCQSSISGRETGRWAMSPHKFEIFLTFPYFLRS